MSRRYALHVRLVLGLARRLVPGHRRRAWWRQWEAELAHRQAVTGEDRGMLRFALGAVAHALHMRREEGMMRGWLTDLVYSVRSLARRPAFLLLSVLTLGVGIGSVTAVVSIADAVLLRTLPHPDSEQLVGIFSTNPARGMERFSVSYPDFVDWTSRGDLFQSASFYAQLERDLSGEGDPERLLVAGIHMGFFETLGTGAVVGRLAGALDQDAGAPRTVVLSHALWIRRFGADAGVVGQTLRLDAEPHTVIGVAAPAQGWPRGVDAWVPLRYGSAPPELVDRRSNHRWQVVARLQPEVDADVASAQVRSQARAWYEANASGGEQSIGAEVVPLRATGMGGDAKPALAIMGVAVLLVLLIACINQANLLLVNAWSRGRELSLRSALGAGRGRLVALLLSESALLSFLGAATGLGLAWLGIRGLESMAPAAAAGEVQPHINMLVALAALALALATTVISGLAPAVRAARTTVSAALSEGGAGAGMGRGGVRMRRALVVLETTLSVVLLAGAGMAIRTFQAQVTADTGFDAEEVVIFNVRLPTARYPDAATSTQYFDDAVQRLESLPGVRSASATSSLPLGVSRYNLMRAFLVAGAPEPPAGPDFGALWIEVDPEYFHTLGVAPVRGRAFTAADGVGDAPVMMVNEAMAARISPDQEIVGRSLRSWRDEDLLREVVGVLPDYQLSGMAGAAHPAVYVPRAQGEHGNLSFMVRTAGGAGGVLAGVRAAMRELDPNVALQGMRTLREAHEGELAGIRIVTMVFGMFGVLALLLAVSGVYGLVATSVEQRTREIGIRMALGGSRSRLRLQVLGEGALLAGYGIAAGLLLAAAVGKVIAGVVVGLPWMDVRTLGGVALLISLSALVASWVPAVRATRVDPVRSLRAD